MPNEATRPAEQPAPSISADFLTGSTELGLDRIRTRLLDLTNRNKLLNFRHTTASSLRVVGVSIDQVFKRLRDNEKLSFLPVPEPDIETDEPPDAKEYAEQLGWNTSYDLEIRSPRFSEAYLNQRAGVRWSFPTPQPTAIATIWLALLLVCAPTKALFASDSASSSDHPVATTNEVPIEFWNREITVLRSTIAGADPEMRAERILARLDELPLLTRASDIALHPFNVEGQDGMAFTYDGRVLLFLSTGDLDEETGETLAQASQSALHNLGEALNARSAERSWPVIRSALLFTLIGLVILLVAASLIWTAHSRLTALLHRREPLVRTPLQLFGIDIRPPIDTLVYAALRAVAAVLIISAIYSWASLSLQRFPYTEPWGDKLGRYVLQLFQHLGRLAVDSLPGLFAVVVIFFFARGIVRLGRAFFEQVVAGRVRISWLEPETAQATERIFTGVAWILAIVVAYPYIPGSGTDAFKGISVFVGLMISLGSTGIINQVMSGLFVVYSRALKPGEWVLVNDVEGEVLEVGLLAGKVRTVEGQEVTIPNSVLVGTATKNFTRLGYPDGMIVSSTVTIGYDAPWRQVEGLLLLAADRTPNVRQQPQPYVLQRQLSDFYVAYTLIARITDAKLRIETLSDLHAHIQDAFNEFGVQIMSPHFMMQPQGAVTVPPSKWHTSPAVGSAPEPGVHQKTQHAGTEK